MEDESCIQVWGHLNQIWASVTYTKLVQYRHVVIILTDSYLPLIVNIQHCVTMT